MDPVNKKWHSPDSVEGRKLVQRYLVQIGGAPGGQSPFYSLMSNNLNKPAETQPPEIENMLRTLAEHITINPPLKIDIKFLTTRQYKFCLMKDGRCISSVKLDSDSFIIVTRTKLEERRKGYNTFMTAITILCMQVLRAPMMVANAINWIQAYTLMSRFNASCYIDTEKISRMDTHIADDTTKKLLDIIIKNDGQFRYDDITQISGPQYGKDLFKNLVNTFYHSDECVWKCTVELTPDAFKNALEIAGKLSGSF